MQKPYHIKLSKKGEVVIPLEFRDELWMRKGDKLAIRIEDGEIRIYNTVKVFDNLDRMIREANKEVNQFVRHINKLQ